MVTAQRVAQPRDEDRPKGLPTGRARPVGVHVRTGVQGDGEKTYAIGVPRALAEQIRCDSFLPELLPGGTLVFRPLVPMYERVEEDR